jgi:hypothetical protein
MFTLSDQKRVSVTYYKFCTKFVPNHLTLFRSEEYKVSENRISKYQQQKITHTLAWA